MDAPVPLCDVKGLLGCLRRHKNVDDLLHGVLLTLTIHDVCVHVKRIAGLSVIDDEIFIEIEILLGRGKDLLTDTHRVRVQLLCEESTEVRLKLRNFTV